VLESAGAEVALKAAEDGDTGLKLLQKDHELAEIKFHEQVEWMFNAFPKVSRFFFRAEAGLC
jgi:hypothetical protein